MTRQDRTRSRPSWEKAFLRTLAETGHVRLACRTAGVSRSAAYEARATHRDFAEAWEDALEERADLIEAEVRRRAMEGVEEVVYRGGQPVAKVRRYSDQLLMMLARGARPWKFSERYTAIEERVLGNVEQALTTVLARLNSPGESDAELRRTWRAEYYKARG